ncbi:DUF1587 domain-containing protein [Mariniblastus sp.]|nr:DUF1587 domain-containing protein [bacterium]MDA7911756.1 DUF1587 domain-containing protein [bacterium]MDB4372787.1 DUF1587 domain-containing protein [Mariniblastus sp.]MDB4386090.1 DUF1587 domain-containing protein [bacterium]
MTFLDNYCVKCHGADELKGDVRLDRFDWQVTGDNHELWEEIIHKIQRGEMPPEDSKQPTADERRAFLTGAIRLLTRYEEEIQTLRDPLMRLTNNQIAHSLQDLIQTHEHIADQLIGDPIDKHGFSRQAELDLSGSYLQLYTDALEQIVERAMPNLEPARPDVFRIAGNDWEKCHWGGDNYLYQGYRRLYEGPKWIGDDFEIPIPPKHEYRMFLRENRSMGKFRIKLTLRNEPPTYGYGEHFLIKPEAPIAKSVAGQVVLQDLTNPRTVQIPEAGIYQIDVFLNPPTEVVIAADSSKLRQGLVGSWGLNGDTQSESKRKELTGKLEGGATFVDSPIGKQGKAVNKGKQFLWMGTMMRW